MLEDYFVSYLVNYPWEIDPDASPDLLVSAVFVASSEDEARRMAKEKIPQVLAAYTDEGDDAHEEDVEITVRPWSAWGNKLKDNWEAICNTEVEDA